MAQASSLGRRIELLGAGVDLVTCEDVVALIDRVAEMDGKAVVANHNLHSLYLTRRSPEMTEFFASANLVEIDSMPMVLWARLMGHPATRANRCTYLDWRARFWKMASARRWRVFCLGSEPGVADQAARRLMAQWPGVQIETHHGFFDAAPGSADNQDVLGRINAFQPHVLMVGMGMPRQEIWIGQNLGSIERGAVLSVGAAFDYEAGVQRPAPRIYGQLCLEWLYRLAHDPRRLFGRYLLEPWSMIGPALADVRRRAQRANRERASASPPSWAAAGEGSGEDLTRAA